MEETEKLTRAEADTVLREMARRMKKLGVDIDIERQLFDVKREKLYVQGHIIIPSVVEEITINLHHVPEPKGE